MTQEKLRRCLWNLTDYGRVKMPSEEEAMEVASAAEEWPGYDIQVEPSAVSGYWWVRATRSGGTVA